MPREELQVMVCKRDAAIDDFYVRDLFGRTRTVRRCGGKIQYEKVAAFVATMRNCITANLRDRR